MSILQITIFLIIYLIMKNIKNIKIKDKVMDKIKWTDCLFNHVGLMYALVFEEKKDT